MTDVPNELLRILRGGMTDEYLERLQAAATAHGGEGPPADLEELAVRYAAEQGIPLSFQRVLADDARMVWTARAKTSRGVVEELPMEGESWLDFLLRMEWLPRG